MCLFIWLWGLIQVFKTSSDRTAKMARIASINLYRPTRTAFFFTPCLAIIIVLCKLRAMALNSSKHTCLVTLYEPP